jgi:hypothetical protein
MTQQSSSKACLATSARVKVLNLSGSVLTSAAVGVGTWASAAYARRVKSAVDLVEERRKAREEEAAPPNDLANDVLRLIFLFQLI